MYNMPISMIQGLQKNDVPLKIAEDLIYVSIRNNLSKVKDMDPQTTTKFMQSVLSFKGTTAHGIATIF